jgi:hypothetical protein
MTKDEEKEYWMRCFCAAIMGLSAGASDISIQALTGRSANVADEAINLVRVEMDRIDDPK